MITSKKIEKINQEATHERQKFKEQERVPNHWFKTIRRMKEKILTIR
jgi:hypothetical protein